MNCRPPRRVVIPRSEPLDDVDACDETEEQSHHGDNEEADDASHDAEDDPARRNAGTAQPSARYEVLHDLAHDEQCGRHSQHDPGRSGPFDQSPDGDTPPDQQQPRQDRDDDAGEPDGDADTDQNEPGGVHEDMVAGAAPAALDYVKSIRMTTRRRVGRLTSTKPA